MSRRSRLATVVRVADLRETIARGEVAAAGAATARAVQDEQARRDALAAGRPDGTAPRTAAALHTGAELLARRAEAVALAGLEVARTRAARADAVAALTEAARRASLFATLADRLRQEDEVARLQADQRAADDSTVARHVRGGAA